MSKLLVNIGEYKDKAIEGIKNIDTENIKKKTSDFGKAVTVKAGELKDSAIKVKEDIQAKITELDRMLEQSITDYNDAYTLMNDSGMQLYISRCRSSDMIGNIENLVNSIANKPKSFESDFEEIVTERNSFRNTCDFAEREIHNARIAAGNAGAGLAAGASVAFMGPTAAMWIATTFGTASTGIAISALSGAAATNAALAWIGGGALAAGGGGMSAGTALLALSGPIGWGIAGATLLGSVILFSTNKIKLDKQKNEEILAVKDNTERVREVKARIDYILDASEKLRKGLSDSYEGCMKFYNGDYSSFGEEDKKLLASLVMTTKALSEKFGETAE